ncbi:mitochondrial ATP synthase B chain precursor [Phthorimaea operculella]|nr:mitochondrial ATP synthase B chain precursor [Phthorimaea operculella]
MLTRVAVAGYANGKCQLGGGRKRKGASMDKGDKGDKGASGGEVGAGSAMIVLKRAERSAKCRLIWFPEEWFTFFHVKTGVSGFYVLLIGLANYCLSKEIYVLEHEYYTGLSWILMLWFAVTKMGPPLAKNLDKQVDDITEGYYAGRKQEIAFNEAIIKNAQLAQKQAQGQELLIAAKKENVLMQLEAVYRERAMMVYRTVKARMDYHAKLREAEARIQQKWMISWILQNVMNSITPEFEASALSGAIKEIEEVASRA